MGKAKQGLGTYRLQVNPEVIVDGVVVLKGMEVGLWGKRDAGQVEPFQVQPQLLA